MEINLNRGMPGGMPGMPSTPPQMPLMLMVLGGGAIFLGLLLFLNEWLLRYMVAGLFCVVGFLLVMLGVRLKRMFG